MLSVPLLCFRLGWRERERYIWAIEMPTIIIIMITIIIIMIIIIIIIAFSGAIRDFLQPPHCAANRLLKWPGHSQAHHLQHIEHLSHATCYVPRGTKGQLSY